MRRLVYCTWKTIKSCHGRKRRKNSPTREKTSLNKSQWLEIDSLIWKMIKIFYELCLWVTLAKFTWLSIAPRLENAAVIRIASFFLGGDAFWVILRPLHHVLRSTWTRSGPFLCNACCYMYICMLLFVLFIPFNLK